jgi:P4 family phage/plasmid primase-like protien
LDGAIKSAPKDGKTFDWQQCVAALTPDLKRKLADGRGLSANCVDWLHRERIIGIYNGKIAFAVHKAGQVVGCHYLADPTQKLWKYYPKGNGTQPLVFGDIGTAATVLCFESQWDAFAVMDKLCWHLNAPAGIAVFITRGAENGKLITSQCSPGAVIYGFVQNDIPKADGTIPAEKWLADIAAQAGCKVMRVTTPAPHKDANDWTRAGASKTDIEAAISKADVVKTESARADCRESSAKPKEKATDIQGGPGHPGHLFVTPNGWFVSKFPGLADEFGDPILESVDKNGTVSVEDIAEDFLAATMGEKGTSPAPTVFASLEDKFYTYSPGDGLYLPRTEPSLLAGLSKLLLECARACKQRCDTKTLEFRFRDSANLSGTLRKARGILDVPPDYFSNGLTEFIPCANGMLRLSDKTLLPFSPAYRRRNKLAVPFDPAATCPLFLDTLMRPALALDDLELIQQWCGLALIGENLAQKILLLIGTAGGGKGTLVRVINGVIGQVNLASLRTKLLEERFELGRLLGKTLLYGADVPENFLNQRAASVLKALTGGDPATLEFKNSNEVPSIICRFNVILTCNSRLTVHLEGDTEAWRRRLAIVEYCQPKPKKVIDDLSEQILSKEGAGVLNWQLAGLDKLASDGWQLTLTGQQQARVDNVMLESDGHSVFSRECLVRDGNGQLTVPECFSAYVRFCTQRGWNALTKNKFGSLIGDVIVRQFGLTVRHDIPDDAGKLQRGWRGIAVVSTLQSASKNVSGVSELSEILASDIPTNHHVAPKMNLVEELV